MPQYAVIAVIPLLFLWPISWILSPCAPCTPATTTVTTTVFTTATILPSTTRTVTSWEYRQQRHERLMREANEVSEKTNRMLADIRREREASKVAGMSEEEIEELLGGFDQEEATKSARLLEEEREAQASWSTWFMNYCLQPIVCSLSACVAVHVVQNWHSIQASYATLRD